MYFRKSHYILLLNRKKLFSSVLHPQQLPTWVKRSIARADIHWNISINSLMITYETYVLLHQRNM